MPTERSTHQSPDFSALEDLLLQAPVGIAIYRGEDLVIELVNDTMLSYWGRTKEQAYNTPLWNLLPEAKSQGFDKVTAHVYATGEPFTSPETPVTLVRNGKSETIYAKFGFQPRRDDNGKIIGLLGIANDVTEQVLARKKVEESESYFRRIVATIPSTIWTTDKSGYCTFLSQEWYESTGQSKEESLGFGWLNAIHPDDKESSGKIFLAANEKREKFSLAYRLKTKDRGYRWFTDSGTPRFDSDGNFEGFIGTVIDIHEEKTASDKINRTERELSEALEKLRIATESASVGTWSLDVKTETLEWSPLHKKLWGYDENRNDLKYSDWYKVILDEDRDHAFRKVESAKVNKTQYEASYRIKRADDSSIRWMKSVGKYFYDESGEPVTLTGTSVDVTDQKSAEERFRTLAETLPQLVWMTDSKGDFDYASRHWQEYTGVDPKTPGAWDKVVHPDDAGNVMRTWMESIKTGRALQVEARLKSKHGIYRWHYASAEPVLDEAGKIIRWIGAYSDVHEQKTLTETLEKAVHERTLQLKELNGILQHKNLDLLNAQNFLQQVIDSSIEFVCVLDRDLNFITVNKKYEETRGMSKDFLVGKNLFELTPKARGTEQHDSILKALKGETIYLSKKPSVGISNYIIDTYFVPLVLQGKIEGVILMSRDVTGIVRSEQMLAEKNLLLERSNQDLLQFAHVASHDLKEPFRKIQTFLGRIEADKSSSLSETSQKYVSKIHKASLRMANMIDGVLSYSSTDASAQLTEEVNLNEVLKGIETDLELMIANRHAIINSTPLPVIEGSRLLLTQLFYNLVHNALKFSRTDVDPLISITYTNDTDGYLVINLKDNGIGFEQAYADKIFETFSRLNTKDAYEGTGLGLALCRKIVERHRGKIWASSAQGKGAEFFIRLPYAQERDQG